MQAVNNEFENNVSLAMETIIEKRPMLEPIIRSFAAILQKQSRIAQELEAAPAYPEINPGRLLQGIPLLAGVPLDVLSEQLNRSFLANLTVLKTTFSNFAADFSSLEALQKQGKLDLSHLSRAYLDGEIAVIRSAVEATKVSEGMLALVLDCTLSTVLKALRPSLARNVNDMQWYRGYCPMCGSMPSISYLAEAGDLGSEFLRGGGGQRYLHCSLCGHDWRFLRGKCPACETEDKDLQLYFQLDKEPSERVDVCRNCKAYLPCIDLRESMHRLPMDIAAVGLVHLDAWASEKGYHPLAQTPWNLVQ